MSPKFLRDEAARFRGMASDADRPETKLRLLAMAADYEVRAAIDNEVTAPKSHTADKQLDEANSGNATVTEAVLAEAEQDTRARPTPSGSPETTMVQRRPIGRPRRA